MTSYSCLSDVTKILSTTVCNSIVAMVTDLIYYLTYNSRGVWHTVYAILLSNSMLLGLHKVEDLFSPIYNLFTNNLILCYTVKILKIGTPEIITIIVLQLEQLDFTVQYCVQKMQTE